MEVFSAPLWLCLDLSFVVEFYAIHGVIYQLLTKSWCVQQCFSECKVSLLRRPELSVMGLAHAQAYLRWRPRYIHTARRRLSHYIYIHMYTPLKQRTGLTQAHSAGGWPLPILVSTAKPTSSGHELQSCVQTFLLAILSFSLVHGRIFTHRLECVRSWGAMADTDCCWHT